MKTKSCGILLPETEIFDSFYGGAIARWVYEIYILTDSLDITIYGRVKKNSSTAYQNLKISTKFNFLLCTIRKLPFVRRSLKWIYCLVFYSKIKNSHIIEIHNEPSYVFILRNYGYKGIIILHMHNDYFSNYSTTYLNKLSVKLNRLIVCSKFLNKTIQRSPQLLSKSVVIYNGFDSKKFYQQKLIKSEKLSIGFVGRIDENKGLHILLSVYQEIIKTHPEISLNIVGSSSFGYGGSKYELSQKLKANEINSKYKGAITFHGYMSNDQLVNVYNSINLLCSFSTKSEAFGMNLVECLACGTPVLANDIGGVYEAVGDKEMLVTDLNIERIAIKVLSIINDKDKTNYLSKIGKKYVEKKFKWSLLTKKMSYEIFKLL
jgi:glycosyltransferase involved in cell wall biosynthesis